MVANSNNALRVSASAGSGKTFTLTKLYLKKALEFPGAFRGIVAITFTNKAVEELKERIVKTLFQLSMADPQASIMAKELGFSTLEEAGEPAKRTLYEILHDFDYFQISTIDSFFQKIFNQLAYEIDLPQGLSPDMDVANIKAEILLSGLAQMDPDTQNILTLNLLDLLSEKGKGWRPVSYLESELIENLFLDKVMEFQYTSGLEATTGPDVVEAGKKLRDFADGLEAEMRSSAARVVETCHSLGFSPTHLDREKDRTYLEELAKLETIAFSQTELKPPGKNHSEGKFYRKPKSRPFSSSDEIQISAVLMAYSQSLSAKRIANMNLARKLARHLSAIRLLFYFKGILNQRNRRLKRYLLQEVQYILRGQVEQSVVPYLFEKLGNKTHTMLIDEFQDTSLVQWKVISPLAKAILDEQGQIAIVGDVKQSIYSWRGGDSTLFKSGIEKSLYPNQMKDDVLDYNFRSQPNIVQFNNWLFSRVPGILFQGIARAELANESSHWEEIFQKNYQDLVQKPSNKFEPNTGFVNLRLRTRNIVSNQEEEEEDEFDSEAFAWLIPEIRKLRNQGIPLSEMAILVRSNKHIRQIISLLDQAGNRFPDEDFRFNSSAEMVRNEHPLMRFLFLALESFENLEESLFYEMESLAATLGLAASFHLASPGERAVWRSDWKSILEENSAWGDWPKRLEIAIRFFGLAGQEAHQFLLVEFQNLVLGFQWEDNLRYNDFGKWWKMKAGNEKLKLPGENAGIQIMTIHKSKGLDFGVVILAIEAHSGSDRWSDFVFWVHSEEVPWNSFPLLQTKATSSIRDSDLGSDYSNEIYIKVLESLNTWYVACTRPRYGLIIDISIDKSWNEESNSKGRYARLGYLIPSLLQENKESIAAAFPGSTLVENEGQFLLDFRFGQLAVSQTQTGESQNQILEKYNLPKESDAISWSHPKQLSQEGRVGELTHLVLEKTIHFQDWKLVFNKLEKESSQWKNDWPQVKENVESIFRNVELRNWLSENYISFSEHELLDQNGNISRVDRIIKGPSDWIVLDFKTGNKVDEHQKQIREYACLLNVVKKCSCRAFLVYTHPPEVVEVQV